MVKTQVLVAPRSSTESNSEENRSEDPEVGGS